MSRVFTTRFTFRDKEYVALVSVKRGPLKPHYTIRLFDEQLQDLVNSQVIEYDGFEGYLQHSRLRSDLPRKLIQFYHNWYRENY